MIESKKTEIRYTTSDPQRMLGKWIAKRVVRTWKEDFADEDTGEVVTIDRCEVLFERGTYISQETLAQIRFFMSEGSIKEVEVSNQNRQCVQLGNTSLSPYLAQVEINEKKLKFLLHASGIQNVLEIVSDFVELNYKGNFYIQMVKRFGDCVILEDTLKKVDFNMEYLKSHIDAETYAESQLSEGEEKNDENKKKFYQIDVNLTVDGVTWEKETAFVVLTTSVDKAMLIINAYIAKREKERLARLQKSGYETDESEPRDIKAAIERATAVPISRLIPLEFSMVYND